MSEPTIPLLQRREIEARIIAPLLRAFMAELGEARTLEIVGETISQLAQKAGADLARDMGEATLSAFSQGIERWKEGGALELDILRESPEHLDFNVTRCRYAEMYRSLGMADLGASLSCQRDFALIQGFNPDVELQRTQTLMQGADFCDFRFRAPAQAAMQEPD